MVTEYILFFSTYYRFLLSFPIARFRLKKVYNFELRFLWTSTLCYLYLIVLRTFNINKIFFFNPLVSGGHKELKCVASIVFQFINGNCPYYLNEVFEFLSEGNVSLRNNFLKPKRPFRNTNTGQKASSFVGPSFWNQLLETL